MDIASPASSRLDLFFLGVLGFGSGLGSGVEVGVEVTGCQSLFNHRTISLVKAIRCTSDRLGSIVRISLHELQRRRNCTICEVILPDAVYRTVCIEARSQNRIIAKARVISTNRKRCSLWDIDIVCRRKNHQVPQP